MLTRTSSRGPKTKRRVGDVRRIYYVHTWPEDVNTHVCRPGVNLPGRPLSSLTAEFRADRRHMCSNYPVVFALCKCLRMVARMIPSTNLIGASKHGPCSVELHSLGTCPCSVELHSLQWSRQDICIFCSEMPTCEHTPEPCPWASLSVSYQHIISNFIL